MLAAVSEISQTTPQPPLPPFPQGMLAQGPGQARGETPAPPPSHPPHPRRANSFLSAPGPPAGGTDRPGPPAARASSPPTPPGPCPGAGGEAHARGKRRESGRPLSRPFPSLPAPHNAAAPSRPRPRRFLPPALPNRGAGHLHGWSPGRRRRRRQGKGAGEGVRGRGGKGGASQRASGGRGRPARRAGSAAGAERRPHWAPGSRRLLLTIPGRRGGSSSPSRRRSARGVRTPAPAAGSPSPPLRPVKPPLASLRRRLPPHLRAALPPPGPGSSRTRLRGARSHPPWSGRRAPPPLPARAEGPPRSAPRRSPDGVRGLATLRAPTPRRSSARQPGPLLPPVGPAPGPGGGVSWPRAARRSPFPWHCPGPGAECWGRCAPGAMWPLLTRPMNRLPGAWTISQNRRIN